MAFFDLGRFGDRVALLDETGRPRSYADLIDKSSTIEARLPRDPGGRGFGFLVLAPIFAGISAYLGCLRSRAHVPLLVQPDINPELLAGLARHYRPNWILAPAGLSLPQSFDAEWENEALVLAVPKAGAEPTELHPDLALLLSTSGSTGTGKLVRLSYDALSSNAEAIVSYLELERSDRAITTLPLAYSFGMSILNSHLAAGASLVLTNESLMSRDFWTLAADEGVTSLSGVPSTFEMLRRVGLEKRGLDRLRTLTQAGGAMRPALTSHFDMLAREQGWRLFVMYGQTEAAPRISYVPPHRLHEKIGSIGVPVPGGTLRIDPDSSELVYEGPNVMMGYAEDRSDLARGDECGGVLRTGDLGMVDEDGFFTLTGRLKRFVKLSGSRINLDVVEAALAGAFSTQIVCTGEDERLRVWVLDSAAPHDEEVSDRLRSLYGIYPGLVEIRRIASFPLTSNGKIDLRSLTAA